jgi:hypothetical protein
MTPPTQLRALIVLARLVAGLTGAWLVALFVTVLRANDIAPTVLVQFGFGMLFFLILCLCVVVFAGQPGMLGVLVPHPRWVDLVLAVVLLGILVSFALSGVMSETPPNTNAQPGGRSLRHAINPDRA